MSALDPQAVAALQHLAYLGHPSFDQVSPSAARQIYRETRQALRPAVPSLPAILDLYADTAADPVPLRLYRPAEGILPVLVYFHGGGWMLGDLDTHDVVCRQLAAESGAAVVAVDYRLAPEHRFPAAVEDAWNATRWIAANAQALGLDARLAVAGDSAGGGLAAVVSLMSRDAGLPLVCQLLVYPVTDLRAGSPSYTTFAEGYALTRAEMLSFIAQYAANAADVHDWRASPLLAPSVAGVPPALIVTAALDPLRDEGAAYARRLEEAGVVVEYACLEGMMHGFLTMGGWIDTTNQTVSILASTVRQAFTSARPIQA